MLGGLRSQSDFFNLDFGLCFAGFLILLRFLVEELSIVENSANRRISLRCYFDKVQIGVLGNLSGLLDGDYTNIVPIRSDQAHLACAYFIVDAIL